MAKTNFDFGSDHLQPCPYCQGKDLVYIGTLDVHVKCRDCECFGPRATSFEVAKNLWNRRG